MSELIDILDIELRKISGRFSVCGFVNQSGDVYPLGSDTKVLSTVFELVCRPVIISVAKKLDYEVIEPVVQNHYPDFSLVRSVVGSDVNLRGTEFPLARSRFERPKIAIDVKTTYRGTGSKFSYTLGGYTSFIRPGSEEKNIVFPFHDYVEHFIIGFVYSRSTQKKAGSRFMYSTDEVDAIPLPIEDIKFFVQEKWRIAGDRAGSGNTTNIGSINGTLEDFRNGNGPFRSEEEFLEYWRGYKRTAAERSRSYSNILEFRRFKQTRT